MIMVQLLMNCFVLVCNCWSGPPESHRSYFAKSSMSKYQETSVYSHSWIEYFYVCLFHVMFTCDPVFVRSV